MMATLMILIISGRMSPVVVLILTPLAFGLLAGFGAQLGPMMLKGIGQLAPTAVMLGFAILYFGLMVDAGLFDPVTRFVVRVVHDDPVRITVGTVVLALAVSLDGNGATTYIICVSAMMPLYRRMGLSPLILACLLVLSVSIGHIVPWAGPTARAAIALGINPADIYTPLLPAMIIGALSVIGLAYAFGLRHRRLLHRVDSQTPTSDVPNNSIEAHPPTDDLTKRPRLFLVNLIVTVGLLAGLVFSVLPLPILFMIASAIGLQLNYPSLAAQKVRIAAHAPNIFKVVSLTFAAGIFLGVLNGTGMSDALGANIARALPLQVGPFLAPIDAGISLPFYYFGNNDGFFFGVLPMLSRTAARFGLDPVHMARAAVVAIPVGLLSPLAGSTYVLTSLVGIEYSQLQRFALMWAVLLSLILLVTAIVTGVIPFKAGQS
jgi:CitMHS family citrate-Mg2+:H+ or citrate-Ca2+:H+ symporter